MQNDDTINRNDINENPRKVENVVQMNTSLLQTIEPTASFAIDKFQNVLVYPSLTPRCLVHFRPSSKWKDNKPEYCYGFDWLRVGDTGDWDDKKEIYDHYANLIGRHYEIGTNIICDNLNGWKMLNGNRCDFRQEVGLYKKYLKESFPKAFFVPLKSRNSSICTNSKLPDDVKKYIDRSVYYYTVPILLLRALKSAKIKVKVELLMPKDENAKPKAIVFREHTQGNKAFTITPTRIDPKTKWQEITIESVKPIQQFELIDAIAVYDDPVNPNMEREDFCGQIRVHPNDKIRNVNILYVKTDIFKENYQIAAAKFFLSSEEISFIKKIVEWQLLCELKVEYYTLLVGGKYTYEKSSNNLVTRSIDEFMNAEGTIVIEKMTDILTAAFKDDLGKVAAAAVPGTPESNPNRYDNYAVVFLVNLDSRVSPSTNMVTKHAAIYSKIVGSQEGEVGERLKETVMHEMLHTLELWHTFNYRNLDTITFQARETANIMDYSHVSEDQKKATGLDRYFLWLWQIRQIWKYLDKQTGNNSSAINIPQESSNQIPAGNESFGITQFISTPRI